MPDEQNIIIPGAETQKLHLFPFICKHNLAVRSSPLWTSAYTVGGVIPLRVCWGNLGHIWWF